MISSQMDEQFDQLRARIEAAVEAPAVLMVSSACPGDGKSITAYGLAASFAASGYSTAFIDANHLSPTLDAERGPVSLEQFTRSGPANFATAAPSGSYSSISLVNETVRKNASRLVVSRAVEACRSSYEVVIIDAGTLAESNLAVMLAKQADGLILTIREGRAVKRADHDLIKLLADSDIPTLGTVTIEPRMISEFRSIAEPSRAAFTTVTSVETQPRPRTAVG